MRSSRILLLGSQHGNELLGKHLFEHIQRTRPQLLPFITYKTGNIRAHKQNIRYIEKDLNRSYTGLSSTYEERRAKRILNYITAQNFDIVLDLHTTTCIEPPCLIIPAITPEIRPFLEASSISRLVQMNHPIVASTLIGKCTQSICVEINKDEATEYSLLDSLCDDIERYLDHKKVSTDKTIYYVNELLKKTELSDEEADKLRNFELSSQNFYPILVGNNSYKKQTDYLGFKAYTTKTIQL